jgi:two-component system sensor histidine kinase PhoQ
VSHSISRRLLFSSLLVLAAFLGLAGTALDQAHRNSTEAALREELQAHVYALLAAADEDAAGRMRLPESLPSPAFNRPDSSLYAEVSGEQGRYHWRSASLLGRPALPAVARAPGTRVFRLVDDLAVFELGVSWEDATGTELNYSLAVATARERLASVQQAFRGTLWRWLGAIAAGLLLAQLVVLRWGLRPLHAMTAAVQRIERGESARIEGSVPRELQGLSDNLNALIDDSERRRERVRHSLADLAHSLKTPLAVLRGSAETLADDRAARLIREQTGRIDDIVRYQRQRATVAGGTAVTRPVPLRPIVARIGAGLEKVFADAGIRCEPALPPDLSLRADEGDLFELFGNLLENAFRHAHQRVRVEARREAGEIIVTVDDDGPGFDDAEVARLLRRGERADERHPGEGIGLAVVDEIVRQYRGSLAIDRAPGGGARVRLRLPA